MNIVKLKVKLMDENEVLSNLEVEGYHHKEKRMISYIEPDYRKTMVEFHYEQNKMIRDNAELYFDLNFVLNKEVKNKFRSKDLNKDIEMKTYTTRLEKRDGITIIEYNLEDKHYKLEITMEELV